MYRLGHVTLGNTIVALNTGHRHRILSCLTTSPARCPRQRLQPDRHRRHRRAGQRRQRQPGRRRQSGARHAGEQRRPDPDHRPPARQPGDQCRQQRPGCRSPRPPAHHRSAGRRLSADRSTATVDIGAFEVQATTHLAVTTQPPDSVTAGAGFGLTVTAEDKSGDVISSFDGTVTVRDFGQSWRRHTRRYADRDRPEWGRHVLGAHARPGRHRLHAPRLSERSGVRDDQRHRRDARGGHPTGGHNPAAE